MNKLFNDFNVKTGMCKRCEDEKKVNKFGLCESCAQEIDQEYASMYRVRDMDY